MDVSKPTGNIGGVLNDPYYTGEFIEWDSASYEWDDEDEMWGQIFAYTESPKGVIIKDKMKGK